MKFQRGFKLVFCLTAVLVSASFAAADADVDALYEKINDLNEKINELSGEVAELKAGSSENLPAPDDEKSLDDQRSSSVRILPTPDYDSGWFSISKGQTKVLSYNLGAMPKMAVIWGYDNGKQYLMDGTYNDGVLGCWLRKVTSTGCEVAAGGRAIATRLSTGAAADITSGNIKVVMWK